MTVNWDDRHGIRLWVKKDGSIAVLGLEIFFSFFLFLFFGVFFVADHKRNTFFFFTSLSLSLSCSLAWLLLLPRMSSSSSSTPQQLLHYIGRKAVKKDLQQKRCFLFWVVVVVAGFSRNLRARK